MMSKSEIETSIEVSGRDLSDRAALFSQCVNAVKYEFDNIKNILLSTDDYWQGYAHNEFIACVRDYFEEMEEVCRALESHEKKLLAIEMNYNTSEKENLSGVEALSEDILI